MAGTKKYGVNNGISNAMGIPAHDYISNTYDGNENLIQVDYRLGGGNGRIVAVIALTYDINNNLLTVERTY